MQLTKLTAPQIDNILDRFQPQFGHEPDMLNIEALPGLLSLIEKVMLLKEQGDDENRNFWITADRGTIEDFGDYEAFFEEGEVENKEEFEQLWLNYYPDLFKWYYISFARYRGELFIYINHKLIIHAGENGKQRRVSEQLNDIITWLDSGTSEIIEKLKKPPEDYYKYLNTYLPFQKRIGKIKRNLFWDIFPYSKTIVLSNLSDKDIQDFAEFVNSNQDRDQLYCMKSMSAADFYNSCSMAYLSVPALKNKLKELTPKEMYYHMADGRDCGLRDIDLNSYDTFEKWYHKERHCGGHPWEILRGGNSTHISLYVEQDKNSGWFLRLAGSSVIRVNETIHIALKFYREGVPFILDDASEILKMALGTDYIGIVNDLTTPRYCHSHFPKEDNIIDFMNLPFEKTDEVIRKAEWYELDKLELTKK